MGILGSYEAWVSLALVSELFFKTGAYPAAQPGLLASPSQVLPSAEVTGMCLWVYLLALDFVIVVVYFFSLV